MTRILQNCGTFVKYINAELFHPSIGRTDAQPLWLHRRSGAGPTVSRHTARRLCETAALATATAFALPVGELRATTRRSSYVAFARQSAMYLSHVSFGISLSEVGRVFGRDRTTAAHACQLVEDRRDDPAVDSVLASLESACGLLRRRLAASVQPCASVQT